ncbi:MAG: dicarboxylate/amino acid:cation symporter [Bacteroidaceae bacterium]|nr:dicarboxylate/amino acid:cation symporter [Bacteroidaceae bacterium]MBQ5475913.1 dicarboxylate/amino acid:cation symporter [Lachnospiraceae bacterium]
MKKNLIYWIGALIIGAILGAQGIVWLNDLFEFIATVFTRLFQFIAIPTIALAILTTLASLDRQKNAGRIFSHTITYTLLTTIAAASIALILYLIIQPENLPTKAIRISSADIPQDLGSFSYYDHIISIIPNNIILPFESGNVLSILIIAASFGLALAFMPESDNKQTVYRFFSGLQEMLFILIRALIWAIPIAIIAFAGQLSAQIEAGVIIGSLGKYIAVVMLGNIVQIFVVLPLFLLARKLNPIKVFRAMFPALLVALFTKSSAGTLPVTIQSAEENLEIKPEIARFVLPICTTINMNGCAAFILVTSLFLMQNGGFELSLGSMILWLFISVVSAIGNAGVPMGCYFLTLSLMSSIGAPIGIMGIILPIYTIIDMVETAENVWSDSCVCAMTNHDLK